MNNNKGSMVVPVLAGITASSIFGLSFLFTSMALKSADTFTLLSFRFILAFLVMSILIALKVIKVDYKGKNLKKLFLVGLAQPIVYFVFETYGLINSNTSISGIILAFIPILVAIASAIFLKDNPTKLQWIFIVISVAGVMFIVIMNGEGSGAMSFKGFIYLFLAMSSAAAFNLLSKDCSKEFKPVETTYFMMGLGSIVFTIIALLQHGFSGTLYKYVEPLRNTQFIIAILFLGILASIIGFLFTNYTLSKMEASKSAIFSNLSTVVSIIAGVLILKEPFKAYQIIGSILIIVGVWGTNYFGKKERV